MHQGILKTKDYKQFQVNVATFESAFNARRALPGDHVILGPVGVETIVKRAIHKGLVGVLEVSSKTTYGRTSKGTPIYLFIPWNESYPPFYVGSNYSKAAPVLAVVDFEAWAPNANCPRGNCRFIIGLCGELGAEEQALLLHACANPWKKTVRPPELVNRLWKPTIALKGQTFHVDPPGCRDIDDAVTFVTLDSGIMEIYIHIADVASLLQTNESLWRAAELGQTLYKDGQVVAGLFPEAVEHLCSLLPLEARPTLTLKFNWNPLTCKIGAATWHYMEVVVKESYTYESIYGTKHAPILKAIASTLASKHLINSHDWIAQLMIFYNREAAKFLKEYSQGILRRHAPPDVEILKKLKGLDFIPDYLAFSAGEYCVATETDVFHWGLRNNVPTGTLLFQSPYCHASSPIRRYTDCINQLCILTVLQGCVVELPPHSVEELNRLSKVARRYERDLFFMRNLLQGGSFESISASIVECECSSEKVKIWIDDWKMILKVDKPLHFTPTVGGKVSVKIHMNPMQRNWKRKLVVVLQSES